MFHGQNARAAFILQDASFVSQMRGTDLALLVIAFEKRSFRNACLVSLTFRFPNADFVCLT